MFEIIYLDVPIQQMLHRDSSVYYMNMFDTLFENINYILTMRKIAITFTPTVLVKNSID